MTAAEKAAHDALVHTQFEESIKDLPENEQALMRKVRKELTDALTKQTADNKAETAKALEEALSQLKEQETIKAMANVLEKQGLAIREISMNKNTTTKQPRNFKEAIQNELESKSSDIQAIIDKGGMAKGESLDFEVKAVTITEAATILAGSTFQSLTQDTGIISPIRQRTEQYLNAVTTGSIGTRFAMWMEETGESGTPIMIAENTGKTQISVLYIEKTQKVEKIAVYSKVTTEMLADLPQLTSRIESNMLKRVGIAIESQLYSGSGVSPYLKGATEWATPFAAGGLAASISAANEIDVINAVANQAILAYGTPNAIFVHPDTLNIIFGLKSTTGEPLYKDYMDWNVGGNAGGRQLTIGGMRVYATPLITSGNFIGGDMKVLNVLFREALNIRITPSGDDPINNLMTLIVESRLVQFASANDVGCLIDGDFETAKAAISALA